MSANNPLQDAYRPPPQRSSSLPSSSSSGGRTTSIPKDDKSLNTDELAELFSSLQVSAQVLEYVHMYCFGFVVFSFIGSFSVFRSRKDGEWKAKPAKILNAKLLVAVLSLVHFLCL
jgi:hypothetical protein